MLWDDADVSVDLKVPLMVSLYMCGGGLRSQPAQQPGVLIVPRGEKIKPRSDVLRRMRTHRRPSARLLGISFEVYTATDWETSWFDGRHQCTLILQRDVGFFS